LILLLLTFGGYGLDISCKINDYYGRSEGKKKSALDGALWRYKMKIN